MLFSMPPKLTILSEILLLFLSIRPVFAQDSVAVAELTEHGFECQQLNPERIRINLDGDWLLSTDNGRSWSAVHVPATVKHSGTTIFKKSLYIPAYLINHNVFSLHIGNGGVSTEIRINNEFVAIHNGAYSPINARIPDRLLQTGSENVVEVICNNKLNPVSTIPLRQLAFQPDCYLGLFRGAYITVESPIYIFHPSAKVSFTSDFSSASLTSDIPVYASDLSQFGLDSNSTSVSLNADAVLISKSSGNVVARSGEQAFSLYPNHNAEVNLSLVVRNPEMWSPSQPNLYTLQLYVYDGKTVVDEEDVDVGFRSLSISQGKFYLNGKPIFIKSVNYNVDYPNVGAAVDELDLEKDIAVIKTLGANAIRVVDFPPSNSLLSLCDRFGLMVFQEIPIVDVPPSVLRSTQYRGSISGYLSEVIRNTRFHPSVVAISVGDGLDEQSSTTRDYVSAEASLVHGQVDWLVYYTGLPGMIDRWNTGADFVGIDLSPFNTGREIKSFLSKQSAASPNTTFWISSVGSQTQISNHNGYSDPLSLEHQARYLVDADNAVQQSDFAGVSVNSFSSEYSENATRFTGPNESSLPLR